MQLTAGPHGGGSSLGGEHIPHTSSLSSQGPASAQERLLQTSQLCFSSLQPPAASSALLRGLHLMLYIFITAFKMQEKKKEWGMNKASSCWGLKTFFLEHEASPTSSPQPAASLSTAPSVPHGHSSAGGQDASTQASSLNPLT